MNDHFFTFRSLTAAQQAAMILTQYGIPSRIVRTPSRYFKNGCSYALRVRDYDRVNAVFVYEGVLYESTFRWNNGDWA